MALPGVTVAIRRGARNAVEERDDLTLLEHVAQRRDCAAYAELFSRYEKRAYSLALHLARNHELAQDAVQDAMLDVWLHASSHRSGHVAGWILRIVANKSITLAKQRKKDGKQMLEQEAADVAIRSPSPAGLAEREEQLGVLRETLERLPLVDRQVLALRYAGGLTQAEIGAALSLSHVAIANRLAKACAQVRAHLAQAGFAAVLPLVSAEGLSEAFCSGYAAPPGLRERVLERAAEFVRESLRTAASRSRLAAAAKTGGGAWILGTAAAVVAVAGLGALWFASQKPQAAPGAPPVAAAPLAAPAARERISRVWDFNSNEMPKDLTVMDGEWHPLEKGGVGGSGCMEIDGKVTFILDLPVEELPVAVSCQIYSQSFHVSNGIGWERHAGKALFISDTLQSFKAGTWCSWRRLVTADAILIPALLSGETNMDRFNVELVRRQDRARLCVGFTAEGAIRIDNLRLESVSPGQVPGIRPFEAALEKIPPSERTGERRLEGTASPVPGENFSVKFFPKSAEPGEKP